MLVELYLLAPVLTRALSSGPKGVAAAVLACLLWGFAAQFGLVSPQVYRLVVIRYVPYILIGGWLRRQLGAPSPEGSHGFRLVLLLSTIVGLAYMVAVFYCGAPAIAAAGWQSTSSLAALWLLPWVWLIVPFLRSHEATGLPGLFGGLLSRIGKATLHIYLVQMVYYLWLEGGHGLQWGPLMLGSVAVCVFYGTL